LASSNLLSTIRTVSLPLELPVSNFQLFAFAVARQTDMTAEDRYDVVVVAVACMFCKVFPLPSCALTAAGRSKLNMEGA